MPVDTIVRTYKTRKAMDAGVREMTRYGYRIVGQSGEFAPNMLTTSLLDRPKVTVTFERQPAAPHARQAASEMDENTAIAVLTKLGYTVRPPGQTN
jgi:hypothetical protein